MTNLDHDAFSDCINLSIHHHHLLGTNKIWRFQRVVQHTRGLQVALFDCHLVPTFVVIGFQTVHYRSLRIADRLAAFR